MKSNLAISFDVSRKISDPEKLHLVTAAYGQGLKAIAKRNGIGWEAVYERAGISGPTAWRVTTGIGSVDAAEALRAALQAMLVEKGSAEIVPPVVVKPPPGLEEWVAAGRVLLDDDPAAFVATMVRVRTIVDGIHERRRKTEAALSDLDRTADGSDLATVRIGAEVHPLPPIVDGNDRGPGYAAGTNGQEDKGPVDPTRKPTRRRRPREVRPRR